MLEHRFDAAAAETVWEAIALHTSPGIPVRMGPEVAATTHGVLLDALGIGLDTLDPDAVAAVTLAHPRGDFKNAVPASVRRRPREPAGIGLRDDQRGRACTLRSRPPPPKHGRSGPQLTMGSVTGMDIGKIRPSAYKQMIKLDQEVSVALHAAQVPPLLVELVRIRVSQINGCAFCLRMHTRDAVAKGETADRLAVLAAWWESQYFTAQERAALALSEEVTSLAVPESRTWDDGSMTQEQASAIAWLATAMNTWNRIAITSHYPVGP